MIERLAKIFKVNKKELQVSFVNDQVAYNLLEEEFGKEILQVAEQKVTYFNKARKAAHV